MKALWRGWPVGIVSREYGRIGAELTGRTTGGGTAILMDGGERRGRRS